MIFVTIGLSHFGFDRLIKEMDDIASEIDEKMVIQSGASSYKPVNADYFKFTDRSNMDKLYSDCRVLVTHAGSGSIINSIKKKIKPIVVPRLAVYKEAFDDHQVEIAKEFSQQGMVIAINNLKDIRHYLQRKNQYKLELNSTEGTRTNLISKLSSYIESIEK